MRTLILILGLTVVLVLILSASALAAPPKAPDSICFWNGTTGNWSDGTKWMGCGGNPPGLTDTATISSGTVTVDKDVTVQGLVLNGGTSGTPTTLQGSGAITVTGTLTWTEYSSMAGTGATNLANGASATISVFNYYGYWPLLDARTFNLAGSAVVNHDNAHGNNSPAMRLNNNAKLNITGTLDFQDDVGFTTDQGTAGSVNVSPTGTLKKTAGNGTSSLGVPVNNTGSVLAQSGTLSLAGGGTSTGSFSAASGKTLDFGGGTHNITLASGKSISGAGKISFSNGTTTISTTVSGSYSVNGTTSISNYGVLNLNLPATTHNLTMSGVSSATPAILQGSSTITVTGTLTWAEYSSMAGTGATNLANGASATISVFNYYGYWPLLDARTFNLAGSAVVNHDNAHGNNSPAMRLNNNARLNVTGTLDFQDDVGFTTDQGTAGSVNVSPTGTLKKTAGNGTSSLGVPVNNTGSVLVQSGTLSFSNFVQNNGVTLLNGGSLAASGNPLNFNGGSLQGSGTINGNVNNVGGTVSPGSSPGNLHIVGNYTQGSTGSLNIELGGTASGTQYDVLDITGAASFSGILNISLINSYTPITGTIFTIANFSTRSGDFITETGTIIGGWLYLTPTYSTNHLSLIASKAVADLSISLTDAKSTAIAGNPITYTLTVANAGPDTAIGALVTDTFPATISEVSWSCVAVGGSCGGTSENISSLSGSGNLNALVNINAGGVITFTIHGRLSPSAVGTLVDTAYVSHPADPNPANNVATDSDTVLYIKVYLPALSK